MYLQKDLKSVLVLSNTSIPDCSQYFLKFPNTVYEEGNTIFLTDTMIALDDIKDVLELSENSIIVKNSILSSVELHFHLEYTLNSSIDILSFITKYTPKYLHTYLPDLKNTSFLNANNSVIVIDHVPNLSADGELDLTVPLPITKFKYYFFYKFMKDLFINKLKLPLCKIYYYYDKDNNLRFRLHNYKFAYVFLKYYSEHYSGTNINCQYFPDILVDFPYEYTKDKELFIKVLKMINKNSLIYFDNKVNSYLYFVA